MYRFIFLFLGCLVALFVIEMLRPVQQHVILPFTGSLADVAAWVMRLWNPQVFARLEQDPNLGWVNVIRPGGLAIVAGCNGVEAVLILLSAVIAFPAPWKHKLAGIGIGFVAIQGLNLVRLISLYYLLLWNRVWFDWFHLYLWQALIILDALVFWLIWLRWLPRPEPAPVAAAA